MIHLSAAGSWAVCAGGAVLAGAVAGWAINIKAAIRMLPLSVLLFGLFVGTSMARGRSMSAPSLLYFDVMVMMSLLFVSVRRITVKPAYAEANEEGRRAIAATALKKTLFVCAVLMTALVLVEIFA
jgi:hypothetical protein